MKNVDIYVGFGIAITFLILFYAWLIYLDNKQPKYEIRFIEGWFVIRDIKSGTHLRRFQFKEDAIEWFNENCKDV